MALLLAVCHIKLQFSTSLISCFLGKPIPKQTLAYAYALVLLRNQNVARLTVLWLNYVSYVSSEKRD